MCIRDRLSILPFLVQSLHLKYKMFQKMTEGHQAPRTQAQISRAAIQRLYVSMRHLFLRGGYKPLGVSGESMIEAMLSLKPEIYGLIADEEKVELEGLLYIFQRLPKGIEQCRYCLLYTSPSPRDRTRSRMPSSA